MVGEYGCYQLRRTVVPYQPSTAATLCRVLTEKEGKGGDPVAMRREKEREKKKSCARVCARSKSEG